MAANTAQGAGQLYDWGDGRGPVHSRPKRNRGGSASTVGGGSYGGSTGSPSAQTTGTGAYGAGASGLPGGPPRGWTPPAVAQQQPIDPQYEAWKAQQGLNTGLADASANYGRSNTAFDTGYNADGTVNTSNPYSQAALLQETFKRNQQGTTTGYANNGQLFTGAYGRMQNENSRNYSIGDNALRVNTARDYHNIDVGQAQAGINYGVGNTSEDLKALLRSLGVNV